MKIENTAPTHSRKLLILFAYVKRKLTLLIQQNNKLQTYLDKDPRGKSQYYNFSNVNEFYSSQPRDRRNERRKITSTLISMKNHTENVGSGFRAVP